MGVTVNFDYDSSVKAGNRIKMAGRRRIVKEMGVSVMVCILGGADMDGAHHIKASYSWEELSVKETMGFKSNTSDTLMDHVRQIIGTGVNKSLRVEDLETSLLENSGEEMDIVARKRYGDMMSHFVGIQIVDSLAEYSVINKLVRTVLVFPHDIVLNLTFL